LLLSCLALAALCALVFAVFGASPLDSELIWVTATLACSLLAAVGLWILPKSAAWRRNALLALSVAAVSPFVGLAWFDASWFYPRLQAGRARIEDPRLATDPRVAAVIEADSGKNLRYGVVRQLSFLPGDDNLRTPLYWHFKELLASWLLPLHADRAEQRALYASLVYVGRFGHGLPAASRGMYGKDVVELDDRQLATVVALTFAPKMLEAHPERLAARAQALEAKAFAGNNKKVP
jgi:hypothetical protein